MKSVNVGDTVDEMFTSQSSFLQHARNKESQIGTELWFGIHSYTILFYYMYQLRQCLNAMFLLHFCVQLFHFCDL